MRETDVHLARKSGLKKVLIFFRVVSPAEKSFRRNLYQYYKKINFMIKISPALLRYHLLRTYEMTSNMLKPDFPGYISISIDNVQIISNI